MIVRAAMSTDGAAVAAIWNAEIRDGISTFTTAEKTDVAVKAAIAEGVFMVAEDAGAVVGFGTYAQFRGGPGYRFTMEHSVYVRPDACGRGVGRLLMQALQAEARVRGVHVLVAAISGENKAAICFHESLGFSHVGRLPEVGRKFDRWMDAVLMQKML